VTNALALGIVIAAANNANMLAVAKFKTNTRFDVFREDCLAITGIGGPSENQRAVEPG